MLDIHSHILPGIDDGASTLEVAAEMARIAYREGITHMAATPHFHPGKSDIAKFLTAREAALNKLNAALTSEGIPLKIIPGAEVRLTYEISKLQYLDKLCIGGTKNILIECRSEKPPNWFESEIYGLKHAGFTPILAHTEFITHFYMKTEELRDLAEGGLYIQLNAMSINAPFYKSYNRLCKKLIKNGLVHFIATDTHDTELRPPLIKKALKKAAKWNDSGLYDFSKILFSDIINY